MTKTKYLKVKDERNLYRDSNSKGIINTDNSALREYKKLREFRNENTRKINQYESDINSLKEEVTEVKDMLKIIFDKINKGA
tara:strand:- start:1142 stop:1387 length:246 start_codon:yes stop_codon:yes gene_type:complete